MRGSGGSALNRGQANPESNRHSGIGTAERPPSRTFGQRLSDIRNQRGLSLAHVGSMVGRTAACVCKWEKGETYPTRVSLLKLAESLDLPVSYLVFGQTEIIDVPESERDRMSPAARQAVFEARAHVAAAIAVDVERIHITIDEDEERSA